MQAARAVCRAAAVGALAVLSLAATAARADGAWLANDETQRLQIRLCDLGYYTATPNGVFDADTEAAVAAYCARADVPAAQGVAVEGVFDRDAKAATVGGDAPQNTPAVTGERILWADAQAALTVNTSYNAAAAGSGIVFHIRYLGGTASGLCEPASEWDAATLAALLDDEEIRGGRLPVVLTLNGVRVTASMAKTPDGRYTLYFSGAAGSVGNLPDLAHERMIRFAAGE